MALQFKPLVIFMVIPKTQEFNIILIDHLKKQAYLFTYNVTFYVQIYIIPRYSGDMEVLTGGVWNVIPGKGKY